MSEAKKRNDELVWRLVEAPDIGGLLLAAVLRLVSGTPLQLLFAGLGDKGNVR